MRAALALLFLVLLSACGSEPPPVDQISLRLSGWRAVEVTIGRDGSAQYRIDEDRGPRSGTFAVGPAKFQEVAERLEFVRGEAVPASDASVREMIARRCPAGTPWVYDRGGFYVRWRVGDRSEHYLAMLGCDPDRNAERNERLLDVLAGLPLPVVWQGRALGPA